MSEGVKRRWYSKTHVDIEVRGADLPLYGPRWYPDLEGKIKQAVLEVLGEFQLYGSDEVTVRTGTEGGWVE